jgi:hypothetical protein
MLDNRPACIKAVADKPGKYLFLGNSRFFLEIDSKGRVHQCKPFYPFVRDGILDAAGWNTDNYPIRLFLLTEIL